MIFGAVAVSEYEIERNMTMYPKDVATIRDITFRYNGWAEYRGPNYTARAARSRFSTMPATKSPSSRRRSATTIPFRT